MRADSVSAVFFELLVPREHVHCDAVTPNNVEIHVWCNARSRSSADDSLDVHYFMVIFCSYSLLFILIQYFDVPSFLNTY